MCVGVVCGCVHARVVCGCVYACSICGEGDTCDSVHVPVSVSVAYAPTYICLWVCDVLYQ